MELLNCTSTFVLEIKQIQIEVYGSNWRFLLPEMYEPYPCMYSCGQKFAYTYKEHVLYIMADLSSNDNPKSNFSVSGTHTTMSEKKH